MFTFYLMVFGALVIWNADWPESVKRRFRNDYVVGGGVILTTIALFVGLAHTPDPKATMLGLPFALLFVAILAFVAAVLLRLIYKLIGKR